MPATHPARRRRRVAPLLLLLLLLPLHSPPAHASREIPVGVYNTNNSALSQGPSRIYALRFVVDKPTRIYRFYSGMNWEGVYVDENNQPAPVEIRSSVLNKGHPSPPPPSNLPSGWSTGTGRPHYAHGNGGTIRARIVPMRPDGTPDLGRVLAEETYPAVKRYKEIKAEWGFGGRGGMVYSNFGGVLIPAGIPHFVMYSNVHPDPRNNFTALQSPTVAEPVAGPNGRNTLDPNAHGAVNGLDPREAVAWSLDSGATWGWGRAVGGGPIPGDYTMGGDDAVRLPWYAWQESSGAALQANQPYYAYTAKGSFTLRVKSSPKATTLTEAGGYAPSGGSVGVVTVKNVRTGATGRTASLGSGLMKGALSPPVAIAAGDTYEISNTGTVAKAEADSFHLAMGLLGPGKTPYETVGHGYDRAELFALPHPWFGMRTASKRRRTRGFVRRRAAVYITEARALHRRGPGAVLRGRRAHRRGGRRLRVRIVGGVRPGRARRGRVVAKAFTRGEWRIVARGRLRHRRFRLHGHVRVSGLRRSLQVRAAVRGVGRSHVVRMRLRPKHARR